ncbi:putative E3 ubiquitin-protein ligase ARI10 [Apostasia shenzhenica]|uniref:RBR-type E3 ubiquitin transferase n=1 Tax=Apostasia shenzhenica TaxID=1088818 RepID=A0A2I0AET7_9ASPA|nr:putative E3 ubiquitin-protein ligase ARI10 [Apostasia shenzhenica]
MSARTMKAASSLLSDAHSSSLKKMKNVVAIQDGKRKAASALSNAHASSLKKTKNVVAIQDGKRKAASALPDARSSSLKKMKNVVAIEDGKRKEASALPDARSSSLKKIKNVVDTNNHRSMNKIEPSTSSTATVAASLTCGICFESKSFLDLLFIKGCFHWFCSRCVAGYVSSKVQENVGKIVCPHPNCKYGMLEPEFCKPILARKVFDRWCDVLCECAIKQKFYCPFKDCSALLVDERSGEVIREAECPHCHRLFCAQCRASWHPKMTCEDFQKLGKDERERGDFLLMNLAKKKEWKRCPACHFYVEKISGCLFLRCRCDHTFCYGCGRTMTQDHYCPVCKC